MNYLFASIVIYVCLGLDGVLLFVVFGSGFALQFAMRLFVVHLFECVCCFNLCVLCFITC